MWLSLYEYLCITPHMSVCWFFCLVPAQLKNEKLYKAQNGQEG